MPSDRPVLPLKWFLLAAAFALAVAGGGLLLKCFTPEKKSTTLQQPAPGEDKKQERKNEPARSAEQQFRLLQLDNRGQVIRWGSAAPGNVVQLTISAQPPLPDARATFDLSDDANVFYSPVQNTTPTSAVLTGLAPGKYWWRATIWPLPGVAPVTLEKVGTMPLVPDFVILPPLVAPDFLQQTDLNGAPLPTGTKVNFGAMLGAVLNRRDATLEVQVAAAGGAWESGQMLIESASLAGTTMTRFAGSARSYRWRARAKAVDGTASDWKVFEPVAQVHFEIVEQKPGTKRKEADEKESPPEVSSSLSSGGGGPSKPRRSIVPEPPPLWELLYRPWMLWASLGSLAVLAGLLLVRWRKSRGGPPLLSP